MCILKCQYVSYIIILLQVNTENKCCQKYWSSANMLMEKIPLSILKAAAKVTIKKDTIDTGEVS